MCFLFFRIAKKNIPVVITIRLMHIIHCKDLESSFSVKTNIQKLFRPNVHFFGQIYKSLFILGKLDMVYFVEEVM